jgi:hypothetical protein
VGVRVCQRASGTEWRQVLLGARDHSPERKKKGQRPLTVWSYAGVTERVFGRLEASTRLSAAVRMRTIESAAASKSRYRSPTMDRNSATLAAAASLRVGRGLASVDP